MNISSLELEHTKMSRSKGNEPSSVLQGLKQKIDHVTDECEDAGAKTLEMVEHQKGQLDRIDEGMSHISHEMKVANKKLTGMEKFYGGCGIVGLLPCSMPSGSGIKKDDPKLKANEDGKSRVTNNQLPSVSDAKDLQGNSSQGESFIQRITNDAREDKMDETLGQVSNMLGNIRNMAIDMGIEIESGNIKIGRITDEVESNVEKIDETRKRVDHILKS